SSPGATPAPMRSARSVSIVTSRMFGRVAGDGARPHAIVSAAAAHAGTNLRLSAPLCIGTILTSGYNHDVHGSVSGDAPLGAGRDPQPRWGRAPRRLRRARHRVLEAGLQVRPPQVERAA